MSHHIRIGAESPLPEAIAQNDHSRNAGTIFLWKKAASKGEGNRQRRKEVGRDSPPGQPFSISRAGEVEGPIGKSGHALKAPALLSPVREVRQRTSFGTALLREGDQAVRVFTRQRAKQDRIDHTEDRRICADAERQREHGYSGETRIEEQHA